MVHEKRGAGPVFLHVGLPKTGTTFLQRLLRENHDLLAAHGVLYPESSRTDMFHGAIEVCRAYQHWGVAPESIDGTWQRLFDQARAFPGTTVLGHETLAPARPQHIEWATEGLADLELHVVVTVRDLGRQLPAWWQEWVKNGHTDSFEDVVDRLVLPEWDAEDKRSPFWRGQDLVGVLRRWGAVVPNERVHVVVAPPPGAEPLLLWRRFADALGVPEDVELEPLPRVNESLGIAEVALLRGVNAALGDRLVQPYYGPVVKGLLTGRVLSPRRSPRPRLPVGFHERADEMTSRWVAYLEETGVRVHGSLDDLRPVVAAPDDPHPDDVAVEEIADLATRAGADLLVEVSRLRRELQLTRRDLQQARRGLGSLTTRTPVVRARRALGRVRSATLRRG